jgi:hypothetical protein
MKLTSTYFFVLFILLGAACVSMVPEATAAGLVRTSNNLGLVGYWSFDDATGTKATDFSGRGNTGTLTSMEPSDWMSGKRGSALTFDGVDEYVSVTDAAVLNVDSNFSLTAWVKLSTSGQDNAVYDSGTQSQRWLVQIESGGKIDFVERNIADNLSNTALVPNIWYHIAIVKSGDSGTNLTLYLNGVADGTASVGSVTTPSGDKRIGGWTENNDQAFNGAIDEIRLYNRALAVSEVAALYAVGAVERRMAPGLGLVGYLSFDDATGTQATDFSGTNNKGTLFNMEVTDWQSGRRGYALNFDGADEYVSAPASQFTTGTSARSIAGWINPSSAASTRVPFAYGDCASGDGKAFGVYLSTTDVLNFWGCGAADFSTGVTVSENTWSHVAVTYDGTDVRVYLNGAQVGSTTARTLGSSTSFWQIGGASLLDAGNYYFPGSIDEVRVYSRALSAAEVATIYQLVGAKVHASQNNRLTSGLKGMWSFNGSDMIGATALERSGQGNNGVLTSGARVDSGRVGQGVRFDGVNDRVVIPHSAAIAGGSGSQTFAMWVYIDSFPDAASVTVMSKMYSIVSSEITYALFVGADSAVYFQTTNGVNFKLYTVPSTSITKRAWYHLALQHTWGSGASTKFYVNGILTNGSWTTGTGNDTFTDQSVSIELGRLNHSNTAYAHWFEGIIDEFRIYNRMLSQSEIRSLYLLGR